MRARVCLIPVLQRNRQNTDGSHRVVRRIDYVIGLETRDVADNRDSPLFKLALPALLPSQTLLCPDERLRILASPFSLAGLMFQDR